MSIKVKLIRRNETKNIEIKNDSTIEDILKRINLKPDTVIVMKKNKPIPIDTEIIDGQELSILEVSSSG